MFYEEREVRLPFSPDGGGAEFGATLEWYGINLVRGDRYGGEWPRERFSVRDVTYRVAERPKSDIYLGFLHSPLWVSTPSHPPSPRRPHSEAAAPGGRGRAA